MPSSLSREEATRSTLVCIIQGKAWTASSIRNPILRKHCRRLGRTFCRSNSITNALRSSSLELFSVVVSRSHLLTTPHPLQRHLVPALLRVAAYADRWIRQPHQWQVDSTDPWHSLLDHLFVRWDVPRFLASAWLAKGNLRHLERDWFCDLACGKSLRHLEKIPATITKRAAHFALQAPDHLTIRRAIRWGQLTAMGAETGLIDEVLKSPIVANLSNEEIWSRLFQKMIQAEHFDPRDFGLVADFFQGLYARYRFNRARQLIQLPLGRLLSHCRRSWLRLLHDALADELKFKTRDIRDAGLRRELLHFANASWEPMDGVADERVRHRSRNGTVTFWRVTQLTRHSQLVAEGLAMNHCVGGYRRDCTNQTSAIFSLSQEVHENGQTQNHRKVTIEVFRRTRRVIQTKRRWNDDPEEIEKAVIQKWSQQNHLFFC